jgi:hypothetical protein
MLFRVQAPEETSRPHPPYSHVQGGNKPEIFERNPQRLPFPVGRDDERMLRQVVSSLTNSIALNLKVYNSINKCVEILSGTSYLTNPD